MTKKIILFIVEGTTDRNTLQPILKKIIENNKIHFHVVRGDITTNKNINDTVITDEIKLSVISEMQRYGFKKSDIKEIIHIIDTDGAFIPNNKVVLKDIKRIEYYEDRIESNNPSSIVDRNINKTEILKILSKIEKIYKKPYRVYYFSRNLEHALHDKIENLSIEEKVELADSFSDRYRNDPLSFISLLSSKEIAVDGNYDESWEYIFRDTNSLKRNSNFHLFFQKKE